MHPAQEHDTDAVIPTMADWAGRAATNERYTLHVGKFLKVGRRGKIPSYLPEKERRDEGSSRPVLTNCECSQSSRRPTLEIKEGETVQFKVGEAPQGRWHQCSYVIDV